MLAIKYLQQLHVWLQRWITIQDDRVRLLRRYFKIPVAAELRSIQLLSRNSFSSVENGGPIRQQKGNTNGGLRDRVDNLDGGTTECSGHRLPIVANRLGQHVENSLRSTGSAKR